MYKILLGIVFLSIGPILAKDKLEPKNPLKPEQVHLSYGESATEMVITWVTFKETDTLVHYGIDKLDKSKTGKVRCVAQKDYVHRVTLRNLKPNTQYIYQCGSKDFLSKEFNFRTPAINTDDRPLSVAIYGDLGTKGADTLPLLINDTRKQMYDVVIHAGDIGYLIGDPFFRKIEPVAAYVPYMTCAGNHEDAGNFSTYRNRFNMPGGTEGLYYSFDLGPVHFIALHTEFYFYLEKTYYQAKHVMYQYKWLERDLQEANKPENRAKRPWIIVFGHHPLYCNVRKKEDCTPHVISAVRKGIPILNVYGLEDILYRYGIDVGIWGHQHNYERTWPLYDHNVFNGSLAEPYRNPGAPVHIVSGKAGNRVKRTDEFANKFPTWSAFRNTSFGFTRMKFYNTTHLHLEQIRKDNKVIDSIWIIKDKHGPYV